MSTEHTQYTRHMTHTYQRRTIECTPETHENWIVQRVEWMLWTSTPVVPIFQHSQPSTFRNRFKEWRIFARISFSTLTETMENWARAIDGDRPHYMSWFNCAFTCPRVCVCVCASVSVVYERMTCTIRFSHTKALWIRLNLDGEFVCAGIGAVRSTQWKVASLLRTNYEQEQQQRKMRPDLHRCPNRPNTHTHHVNLLWDDRLWPNEWRISLSMYGLFYMTITRIQFMCAFHVVAHLFSQSTMVGASPRAYTTCRYQPQLASHTHTNTTTKSENFRTTKRIEYRNIWPK